MDLGYIHRHTIDALTGLIEANIGPLLPCTAIAILAARLSPLFSPAAIFSFQKLGARPLIIISTSAEIIV